MEKKRRKTNILTFFKKTKLHDNIVNKKSENETIPQNEDDQYNSIHSPAIEIANTRDIVNWQLCWFYI